MFYCYKVNAFMCNECLFVAFQVQNYDLFCESQTFRASFFAKDGKFYDFFRVGGAYGVKGQGVKGRCGMKFQRLTCF